MPSYKKKHVNKLLGAPKPKKQKKAERIKTEEIEMSPSRQKKPKKEASGINYKTNMKVLKGKKLERQRKAKTLILSASVIAVICIVINLILPIGIMENLQNLFSLVGAGGYPHDLQSSEVFNTVTRNGYYYVLTDTKINAYSSSGKEVYTHSHGYENPILKTSKTRALVFEQGGKNAVIYNLGALKNTIKTENEIITANISDSGVYAVVTHSASYASVVSVYNKRDKLIYEWYSSADTVNNVAISPNGKKIAVSAFGATGGTYNSSVSILDFDSATPKHTEKYNGTLVYGLETFHNGGFFILTENNTDFIKWSRFNKTEYKNDYSLSIFRNGIGGSAAVFNRESDKTDNRIVIFDSNGEKLSEFEFKGILSDIEIFRGHIYCISDTSVYLLSGEGKILRSAECGFGAVRLTRIGNDLVAVITDNQIEEIKLNEEKEQK